MNSHSSPLTPEQEREAREWAAEFDPNDLSAANHTLGILGVVLATIDALKADMAIDTESLREQAQTIDRLNAQIKANDEWWKNELTMARIPCP